MAFAVLLAIATVVLLYLVFGRHMRGWPWLAGLGAVLVLDAFLVWFALAYLRNPY